MIELNFTEENSYVLGDGGYNITASIKIGDEATATEVIEAMVRIMKLASYTDTVIAKGLANVLDDITEE